MSLLFLTYNNLSDTIILHKPLSLDKVDFSYLY